MVSWAKRVGIFDTALVVMGVLAGLLAGMALGRNYQRRTAQAELDRYTDGLLQNAVRLGNEVQEAVRAVSNDGLPFCSDAELEEMRLIVYNAPDIRDLGRNNGHQLICSTGVGRLPQPVTVPKPDLDYRGMQIHTSLRLMISSQSRGLIIRTGTVSAVLNPNAYTNLDSPPMTYGAYLAAPERGVLMHTFGHDLPISREKVLSGGWFEQDGVLYRSHCQDSILTCFVTTYPLAEIPQRHRRQLLAFMAAGALFGGAIALIAVLSLQTRHSMERQLRLALRRGRIELEYQPVVDLRTGNVVAVETLARWTRSNGDHVRPDIFVAIAENRGFIGELTRYVMRRALAELHDLLVDGSLHVTVNITAHDLADAGFGDVLKQALAEANLPAAALQLELTERSTANHTTAIAAIQRLKDSGHAVLIDDFGTGYSSLAYLHQLAISAIKIDRAFTRTINTGAVTASVVPQILAMAAQLQLKVVVEGIETEEQAHYFAAAFPGAMGQGWFYAHPMPATALREFLQSRVAENA